MNEQAEDRAERLRRRREREAKIRARRKLLLAILRLQAEIAFESNSQHTLQRMLVTLAELLRLPKVSKERREALVEILENSAYSDQPQIVLGGEFSRDVLTVSGSFDVRDLARKMVWGGVAGESNMRTLDN